MDDLEATFISYRLLLTDSRSVSMKWHTWRHLLPTGSVKDQSMLPRTCQERMICSFPLSFYQWGHSRLLKYDQEGVCNKWCIDDLFECRYEPVNVRERRKMEGWSVVDGSGWSSRVGGRSAGNFSLREGRVGWELFVKVWCGCWWLAPFLM